METYEDCTSLIVDLSPLSVGLINVREAICQALADLECPEALSGLWNMELWHPYGLSAILSIQSHCKFYNYEIWQEAMFAQNAAKESLKVKTAPASNVFPNATEVKIFERVEHYYEHPPDSDQ